MKSTCRQWSVNPGKRKRRGKWGEVEGEETLETPENPCLTARFLHKEPLTSCPMHEGVPLAEGTGMGWVLDTRQTKQHLRGVVGGLKTGQQCREEKEEKRRGRN